MNKTKDGNSNQKIINLSDKAKSRYQEMDKDFVRNENIYFVKSIRKLKTQLK